jgi:hypothetical protein
VVILTLDRPGAEPTFRVGQRFRERSRATDRETTWGEGTGRVSVESKSVVLSQLIAGAAVDPASVMTEETHP